MIHADENTAPPATRVVVAFAALFFTIALTLFGLIYCFSVGASTHVTQPILKADTLSLASVNSIRDTTPLIKVAKEQYVYMETRKQHYFQLAMSFYQFFYVFNIMLVILSSLATICVFLIAKHGWDHVQWYLKVLFILTSFCASLLYLIPNVLSNDENLQNNLNEYENYSRQQLITLSGLHEYNTDKGSDDKLDSLVTTNYRMLEQNQALYFKMDNSKVSANPLSQLDKSGQ